MITKEKKPTPLLDLCIKGKKDAPLVIPKAILRDLEPPLIVLSDQQAEAIRKILDEVRN